MEQKLPRKDSHAEDAMGQGTSTASSSLISWKWWERKLSPILLKPSRDLWLTTLARDPLISNLKSIETLSVMSARLLPSLVSDTSVAWDLTSTSVRSARPQIHSPTLFLRLEETTRPQHSYSALTTISTKRCNLTRVNKSQSTNLTPRRAMSSILSIVLPLKRNLLIRRSSSMLDSWKKTSVTNS